MKFALMASRLGSAIRISTALVFCGLVPWYVGTSFTLCPNGVSLLGLFLDIFLSVQEAVLSQDSPQRTYLVTSLRTCHWAHFKGLVWIFTCQLGKPFNYSMRWNQPRHKKGKPCAWPFMNMLSAKHRCPVSPDSTRLSVAYGICMWVLSPAANSSAVVTPAGDLQPSLAQYQTRHVTGSIGWVLGPQDCPLSYRSQFQTLGCLCASDQVGVKLRFMCPCFGRHQFAVMACPVDVGGVVYCVSGGI